MVALQGNEAPKIFKVVHPPSKKTFFFGGVAEKIRYLRNAQLMWQHNIVAS